MRKAETPKRMVAFIKSNIFIIRHPIFQVVRRNHRARLRSNVTHPTRRFRDPNHSEYNSRYACARSKASKNWAKNWARGDSRTRKTGGGDGSSPGFLLSVRSCQDEPAPAP